MKRVFLAIRISVNKEVTDCLKDYQREFGFMKVRWVEPEYLHMTLKFFGPTSEQRIKKIRAILDETLENEQKLLLNIQRLGMFGSKYSPRVLWWGVEEEEMLKELASRLQFAFDSIGLYADRQNFVPHITLGRIVNVVSKNSFQRQLDKLKHKYNLTASIGSIELMESRISNQGPTYHVLHRVELG